MPTSRDHGVQDWDDKDCMRILSSVRAAMGTAACTLLIIEVIVPAAALHALRQT